MLPETEDGYHGAIGKTTRKHLRQYSNQLHRRYPDFELTVLEREESLAGCSTRSRVDPGARDRQGDVSIYEEDPGSVEQVWGLLQHYGLALCGHVGGRCVAGQLLLHVGRETWIHTVGFESQYEDVHLGLLMTYFSLLESIRRGCPSAHMPLRYAYLQEAARRCSRHRLQGLALPQRAVQASVRARARRAARP